MTPDLVKEAEAIAIRLEFGRSDAVARRWAEQDMRALGLRFVARAVRAGFASLRQRFVQATRESRSAGIPEAKPASLHEWQV